MKFYYSHGRTAFKMGLQYLKIKKNDKILMPDYICDVLLDPLKDLEIKPIFYNINKDFTCNFKSIEKRYNTSVKALLLVNYFGFEERKQKYLNFCKKKKIYLIEDSCHSFNINFQKKKQISKFIFYSPKKIFSNLYSGGILKIKNYKKNDYILNKKLNFYKINLYEFLNNFLENNFLSFKRVLKYKFLKKPNFSKLNTIKSKKIIYDLLIDNYSKHFLEKKKFHELKKKRIKNYSIWKNLFKKNKSVEIIHRNISKDSIPWLLPVFVNNSILRKKIFNFGWKNGYSIISWPSLPK